MPRLCAKKMRVRRTPPAGAAAVLVMGVLSGFVVSCASVRIYATANATRKTIHVRLPAGAADVDVYRYNATAPAPMVIVAHGFLRSRRNMAGRGQHLAQEGFVAVESRIHRGGAECAKRINADGRGFPKPIRRQSAQFASGRHSALSLKQTCERPRKPA